MKNTFIFLSFILLISCNQSNNPEKNISTDLATYNNQTISVDDFNQYLLSLPANKRWPLKNTKQWLVKSLNILSINRQLISESQLIGINQETEYKHELQTIKRILYSNQYIQSQAKEIDITDTALREYYDDHSEIFILPEKRTVRHIYKLFNDNKEQATKNISELRKRIIKGESFNLIASKYSDSETRHNDGFIGSVYKGELSKDFDEIVFNLAKDTPSDLVFTNSGIHVFFVDSILANKVFSFESVKAMILQQINIMESVRISKELAQDLPDTDVFEIPSKEKLRSIYQSSNENIILEIGDFALTVEQFKKYLQEVQTNLNIIQVNDLPYIVIQDIAYREIIYQYMIKNNIDLIDTASLKNNSDQILIETMGQYKMKAFLNHHPELIKDFYKQNSMRYASPVMVDLEILRIPKKEGINLMPKLESASKTLNQGGSNFDDLVSKYNGKIIKLGLKNAVQLSKFNKKILQFAFKVKKGQFSDPFTAQDSINILKVVNIVDANEQPLITVRDAVIAEYIKSNTASLYKRVSAELLENLVINDEAVDQYILDRRKL